MTTLVTGAGGFLGSHLVDELMAQKKPVRAWVRNSATAERLRERGVQVVLGDVRAAEAWDAALPAVEVVHHCAAAVGHQFSPKEIYDINLNGVRRMLEAVQRAGKARVILVSSINVLGSRDLDPATEDLPYRRSADPAADVKIAAEELAHEFQARGVDVRIIRPGFIYGPGDERNLPKLARSIERGKFRFIGSRDVIVPIVHVSDVVQAMIRAAELPEAAGRTYNVTDGTRTSIGELADYLAELLACPAPTKRLPFALPYLVCVAYDLLAKVWRLSGPINRATLRFLGCSRFVDINRARKELGYDPRVPYREGMAASIRWIREQPEAQAHAAVASS